MDTFFSLFFCCCYCCGCGCCCLWSAAALVSCVHVLLCDLVTCRAARWAEDTLFNLDNPAPNRHSRKYSGVFQERKPVFPSSQISRRRGVLPVRRLFAACSCPPTLRFPLVHLHWVNFWGRKGRGTEQDWGEDERGERFRQAAPQRCYLLTDGWRLWLNMWSHTGLNRLSSLAVYKQERRHFIFMFEQQTKKVIANEQSAALKRKIVF